MCIRDRADSRRSTRARGDPGDGRRAPARRSLRSAIRATLRSRRPPVVAASSGGGEHLARVASPDRTLDGHPLVPARVLRVDLRADPRDLPIHEPMGDGLAWGRALRELDEEPAVTD